MNNTGAKRTPRREEVTPEPTLLSNMATLFGGFLNGVQEETPTPGNIAPVVIDTKKYKPS